MYNQFSQGIKSKQEQMYVDIVQLVADISRDGFGIDVVNNPLVSGVFRQQLEKHHQKLVMFIYKYIPVEPLPVPTNPSVGQVVQQEYNPQPVSVTNTAPWPMVANSEQSE